MSRKLEICGCQEGVEEMSTATKPVRQTVVEFNDEKEYQRFLNWAYDKSVTNTDGVRRARELSKNHTPAQPRSKKK